MIHKPAVRVKGFVQQPNNITLAVLWFKPPAFWSITQRLDIVAVKVLQQYTAANFQNKIYGMKEFKGTPGNLPLCH